MEGRFNKERKSVFQEWGTDSAKQPQQKEAVEAVIDRVKQKNHTATNPTLS